MVIAPEPWSTSDSNLFRLDLNVLDTLAALLKERNLTHAGARMGLSQPAMSLTLSRLRQYFGDELLVRVGREYRLTPFGQQLLPKVAIARARIAQVLHLQDDFDPRRDARTFQIATSDYMTIVVHGALQRRLDELGALAQVEFIEMFPGIGRDPQGLLGCDLVIAPLATGVHGEHEFLLRDRLVYVADADNPHFGDDAGAASDVGAQHLVAAAWADSPVVVTERWLDQDAVEPRVFATAPGFLGAVHAVRGTDCVALVPERLARIVARTGRYRIAQPTHGLMDMHESLHWHASRTNDPATMWLRRVLLSLFTDPADPVAA